MDRFGSYWIVALAFGMGAVFVITAGQSLGYPTRLSLAVLGAGFFTSGSLTPLNALGADFYPTPVRATGVGWMLGIGRGGGVLGAYIGAPLLGMGWTFKMILTYLGVPAVLAALSLLVMGMIYSKPSAILRSLEN